MPAFFVKTLMGLLMIALIGPGCTSMTKMANSLGATNWPDYEFASDFAPKFSAEANAGVSTGSGFFLEASLAGTNMDYDDAVESAYGVRPYQLTKNYLPADVCGDYGVYEVSGAAPVGEPFTWNGGEYGIVIMPPMRELHPDLWMFTALSACHNLNTGREVYGQFAGGRERLGLVLQTDAEVCRYLRQHGMGGVVNTFITAHSRKYQAEGDEVSYARVDNLYQTCV